MLSSVVRPSRPAPCSLVSMLGLHGSLSWCSGSSSSISVSRFVASTESQSESWLSTQCSRPSSTLHSLFPSPSPSHSLSLTQSLAIPRSPPPGLPFTD
ncbi:hypothetical protein E2C01_035310 [Portunus trituberculatus]|uniref:Uncharacterized protein n=1 Tax=Portunus trituberculatus TaxID=210409 RepID=A0A5B7F900_PORTR|nr:hypothetical protein [Portunus trituberculatus]